MMNVYKVNDCDWYTGFTAQEARDCCFNETGNDDLFPLEEIVALTREELDTHTYTEEDGNGVRKSFHSLLITLPEKAQFFASTEW